MGTAFITVAGQHGTNAQNFYRMFPAEAAAKFPSGTTNNFRQGTIYYHVQASMLASSSQVHGQRTFSNSFVFPTDAAYRQNLVRVA